jgi:hypothetical protein
MNIENVITTEAQIHVVDKVALGQVSLSSSVFPCHCHSNGAKYSFMYDLGDK